MFTIKVYYASGQANIYSARQVNIGTDSIEGTPLSMFGSGENGERIFLDGSETVYIENATGKTVHVIGPKPSSMAIGS